MKRYPIILVLGVLFSLGLGAVVQAELTLYAVLGSQTASAERLYTISTSTGSALSTTNITGLSGTGTFHGLTFDTSTQSLFATWDIGTTTRLIQINPGTGAATNLGGIGADTYGGLAFNSGTLYGVDSTTGDLVTINKTTGAVLSTINTNHSVDDPLTISGTANTFFGIRDSTKRWRRSLLAAVSPRLKQAQILATLRPPPSPTPLLPAYSTATAASAGSSLGPSTPRPACSRQGVLPQSTTEPSPSTPRRNHHRWSCCWAERWSWACGGSRKKTTTTA